MSTRDPKGTITFTLDLAKINSLQLASLRRQIVRAKQAHFVDLSIRINGATELHECDWLKHLVEYTDDHQAAD